MKISISNNSANQAKSIFTLHFVILYLKMKAFILIKSGVFRMVVIGTVKAGDSLLRFVYRNHMFKEMDNDRAFNPLVSRCNTRTNVLSIQESINNSIVIRTSKLKGKDLQHFDGESRKEDFERKTISKGYYYFIWRNIYTYEKAL